MERLPADGFWWIPGIEDERIAGRLEGQVGSITLSLLGSFNDEHLKSRAITVDSLEEPEVIPIVNGVVQGKEVSLIDVSKTGEAFSAPGFFQFKYRPQHIIFGRLVASIETGWPLGLGIEFSHLLQWYGRSGLRSGYELHGQLPHEFTISYQFPDPISWRIPGYSVKIGSGLRTGRPSNGFQFREYAYFKIRADLEKPIDAWITEIVSPLQSLLNIAILRHVNVEALRPIFTDEAGDVEEGEPDRATSQLIVNRPISDLGGSNRLGDEEILFQAEDLTEKVVRSFLDTQSKQAQVREQFLAYEQELMAHDDRFLSYVRLLESMHRRMFPIPSSEVTDYRNRIDLILLGMAQENQEFIRGRLKYGYEPGLPERLHALSKPWKGLISSLFGGKQQFAEELGRIARHRDFLAHQLEESARQYNSPRLARVNLLLTAIFRLNVLLDVGFTSTEAGAILRKTHVFSRLQGYDWAAG